MSDPGPLGNPFEERLQIGRVEVDAVVLDARERRRKGTVVDRDDAIDLVVGEQLLEHMTSERPGGPGDDDAACPEGGSRSHRPTMPS